jgi:hypothetical protein
MRWIMESTRTCSGLGSRSGFPKLRRASLPGGALPLLLAATCCVLSATWVRTAKADTLTIRRPGAHQRYAFEAEPHLLIAFVDPPGIGHGTGYGVGFRGTIPLLHNGFVPTINNSVGLGFGVDFVHHELGRDYCVALNLQNECVRFNNEQAVDNLWLPVVMQWNFWLSRNWSVFGEPGLALRFETNEGGDEHLHVEPFQFYLGGRYHFAETIALTLRVGYPNFSVGVSFLL